MLFRSITAFMFIMGAVTIFSSCQKEQVRTGTTQYDRVVTSQEQRAAEELMEDLPNFAVYNEEENKLSLDDKFVIPALRHPDPAGRNSIRMMQFAISV